MGSPLSVVVLAAGKGTRMKSAVPKVLHGLCGRSMLGWVLEQALALDPARVVLVTGHDAEAVEAEARKVVGERCELAAVRQEPQRGTGHAVQCAVPALGPDPGTVMVLYGDMPLLEVDSLATLLEAREQDGPGGMALLTAVVEDPTGYGRILRTEDGQVTGIVEERDCDDDQRWIDEINPGIYAFDGPALLEQLPRLKDDNAQGELYLTDLVEHFHAAGKPVVPVVLGDAGEAQGVNTLVQLAEARWSLQLRIHEQHMARGVRIEDPMTAYIDADVEIGPDTVVHPCTVIRGGVRIGARCEVGPFAHLRTGAVLEDGAVLGNFCEIKNSTVGEGSKAKHLTYLGDTTIGKKANIGAGTIFANYDGKRKHKSTVGDGAFVGSGTVVVAPNDIPEGATTGAGAVLTRSADMAPGEVWAGLPARRLKGAPNTDPSAPEADPAP